MKKVLASIAAAFAVMAPSGAFAQSSNDFKAHQELFTSLEQAGVTVIVNSKIHCSDSTTDGKYILRSALLTICQDNATVMNGKQVTWTDNDLDTLRHEAHHVVQDCVSGTLGDGNLSLYFGDEDTLYEFLAKSPSWTSDEIVDLYKTLRSDGLSHRVALQELEAYIVGTDISASSINKSVRNLCSD